MEYRLLLELMLIILEETPYSVEYLGVS